MGLTASISDAKKEAVKRGEMPANLPPQYKEAEAKLKTAKTPEEKIAILQEMLAIMPKHKGTDHLKADLRTRISKLEKTRGSKKTKSRAESRFMVEKEGAAQVVVVGPPNCGKSNLVAALTNAPVEVADYPFTTGFPTPGMMKFEDTGIQIVDMPPITQDFLEWWQTALVRNADLTMLVCDLASDSCLQDVETVIERLDGSRITLTNEAPEEKEIGRAYKPAILVGNKVDEEESRARLGPVEKRFKDDFPVLGVSAETGEGIDALPAVVYSRLKVVRIYTKPPGKPASMTDPVIVPEGSTVKEVAKVIHKDFARGLKYTRKWGKGTFDGQRVEKDHVVQDGDVLEFHI